MSAVGRNAPLSPISVGGNDWSIPKYPPSGDAPYPNSRGNLASPPNSGGSNGNMSINGFPGGPRSTGGPSPPASVGRSSGGTNMYARSDAGPPNGGLGGPSGQQQQRGGELDEAVLHEHYLTLRVFLNSRDSAAKQQPNKARDKLLRLSSVQFFELSTDVFDELMRRQALARIPPNAPNRPSAFLLPEKTFHPKRNQARQRLSFLGPPRFRDLAADVFSELERRFPRFVAGEIPRGNSAMSNRSGGRTGTPVNGGYPPRGQSRARRPSDSSSMRGGPPPPDPYAVPPSPNLGGGSDFNRPLPKQINQNNTIIPNKSTMLEEDDGEGSSETDRKLIEDYELQLRELREKLASMESQKKDEKLQEKQEWADKLAEAESRNSSMKQELERLQDKHDRETRDLQSRLDEMERNSGSMRGGGDLEMENEELRNSLNRQQRVTEEVRQEAQEFLREMRTLSEQSHARYEKQVELERNIEALEAEVKEWRNRYARTKTQLRSLRSSSLGLSEDTEGARLIREKGFSDDNGLVKDVHVTKYQISIDDLLQSARKDNPEKTIDAMKAVVVSVRRVTRDADGAARHDEQAAQQLGKLKARVSATANNLITATKHFASGAGISPVSLVDAAASHLTVAIVELLRVCKIRPTPAGELEDDDDGSVTPVDSTSFFSPRTTSHAGSRNSLPAPPAFQGLGGMRASAESSAYSPINSPRESIEPFGRNGPNGITNGYGQSANGRNEGYKAYDGY
ncbi:Protein SPA2 [Beauveria bassiana]|nr:Protein SPA2 [Beauveria bassiana]KAH8717534.1 Protein SPA2 [Beauveria bassiana]